MKLSKGSDWVVIEGASLRTLGDLQRPLVLHTWGLQHKAAVEMTAEAHFEDASGKVIENWRETFVGLTFAQWDWWQDQFIAAARAEVASPEA